MTERDVVLRERAAFLAGLNSCCVSENYRKQFAAERYPLPKVTRPRVLKDPEQEPFEWAAINGVLKVRNPVAECNLDARSWGRANGTDFGAFEPTAARVRMWNDLLMNPTETVDA